MLLSAGLYPPPTAAATHLRAGLATAAAEAGAEERGIMRQARWRSPPTVRRHISPAAVFSGNVSAMLGALSRRLRTPKDA